MHTVIMMTKNEDEEIIPVQDRKWCLMVSQCGSFMPLCTGEVSGGGEGVAEADSKQVERGGITCPKCLEQIQWFKAIRL